MRRAARFYVPLTREQETEIRRVQQARLKTERAVLITLTPEQIVEDAGLEDEQQAAPQLASKRKRARVRA